MPNIAGYGKYQGISLEAEAAYEELYARLARWTREAADLLQQGKEEDADAKLDQCIEILGYLDRGIDMSHNYEVALAILGLHRFAIATLVKAKGERGAANLEPLVRVFLSLADIFAAIRVSHSNAKD
jgi:flagellin-specific chaperone FliS